MRIAVMGAGALGGYFGGRLAAAGHEVTLIARGAHLAALRSQGLRITSPMGDLHLPAIEATDNPADAGPVDAVLFMVKNYGLEEAAATLEPMLGPDTFVATFQNGVSAPDRLAKVIGADRVVPGVAYIPADVAEPGVIRHSAPTHTLRFGEAAGGGSARCQALHDALSGAGTTPVIAERILHDLWEKMIMQASLSALTTLTRLDLGPLRNCPESRDLFRASMAETARVAAVVLPDLPEGLDAKVWDFMCGLPGHVHASMLDDLQRGKPIEVDYLSGDVVRYGREHGVPTPLHGTFFSALKPFVDGPPA